MRKINRIGLVVQLVVIALGGAVVYRLSTAPLRKVAVVDAVKLFNEFEMKKELEAMAAKQLKTMQTQSDSLGQLLQAVQKTAKGPTGEQRRLYEQYTLSRERLQQAYAQSNEQINQQVWKRLNPLIEDYGRQEGLHLMIGANGMGTVLFTDDYFDRTSSVIHYVNTKYANAH